MILNILLFYLLGVFVCAYCISLDVQEELIKQGKFYDFNRILLKVLKDTRGIVFYSWIGLIYYLTRD